MKWLGHILSSEVIDHDQRRESIESSTLTNHIWAVAHGDQKKKNGLIDKEVLDKFGHKMLTRIKGKPTYSGSQVWNEDIWRNVASIPSLTGQGNGLLVNYITSTLYGTISVNPYFTPRNPGTNTTYPPGTAMVKKENNKDRWETKSPSM